MNSNDEKAKDEKAKTPVCKEYNSLKYKTMIMTGENMEKQIMNETNEETLHSFLIQERNQNKKQAWCKLSKTYKIQKIQKFVNQSLRDKYQLSNEECSQTMTYIRQLLERKKLTKASEITYDEESGDVMQIPMICFQNQSRKFTLNKETKVPAKKSKTIKKKVQKQNKIENEVKQNNTIQINE